MADRIRFVIGIDPGITGALALVKVGENDDIALLSVKDMPTASQKVGSSTKSHIIPAALADILLDWTTHPFECPTDVFIESVHAMPGQGVTSMFRFGHSLGLIEGVVGALGLQVHKVQPKEWQALVRVQKDPDAGRLRASQIFPAETRQFARKMDHNRADAALIAYAGARMVVQGL